MKSVIALEEIQDYLFCSLLYYLKYQSSEGGLSQGPLATTDLPGAALSQALQVHASGKHPEMPFRQMVQAVWATWMKQKGIGTDTITMLVGYEGLRRKIMDDFLTGKIKKRGGMRYVEPRMAARYKQMLDHAGLVATAERIEAHLLDAFGVSSADLELIGRYRMADAYADSLLIADRYPVPPSGSVIGANAQVLVTTGNNITLRVKADLLLESSAGTIAVVHESSPTFYFDPVWVGRNLQALALSLYQGDGAKIRPVSQVLVRHLMSGKDYGRKNLRTSRLSLSLLHAARGIQSELYLPAFLSGDLGRCRKCPAASVCLERGEDPLEADYPGLLSWSERVSHAGEEVRSMAAILDKHMITFEDLARYLDGREHGDQA